MRRCAVLAVTAAFLLVAAAPKDDREKLQGTWSIASLEVNQETIPVEKLEAARLIVAGERYSFTLGEMRLELKHKVDEGKSPKELDLTVAEGPEKGKTFRAIYKLEEDRLTICRHVQPEMERPKEFATRPESGLMLIVWKKEKP
jgi:uncharacterized protein (TIGR03067 family)